MTIKNTENIGSGKAPGGRGVEMSHGDSMATENYAGGPRSLEDAEALLAEVFLGNNSGISC